MARKLKDIALTTSVARSLNEIGIQTVLTGEVTGFLDHVAIVHGTLHYTPQACPSNLLHEAGHLACIPPAYRSLAHGSLGKVQAALGAAMNERMNNRFDPDDPLIRAILQCSDPEATAWAYAFGKRIGLADDVIILDSEYDGDGAGVRLQVSVGQYAGINGLRAAGMIRSVRDYPALDKWLQDAL